ncbi:hypothetical protein V6Z12_D11G294000 [Gossypium hirsutum]
MSTSTPQFIAYDSQKSLIPVLPINHHFSLYEWFQFSRKALSPKTYSFTLLRLSFLISSSLVLAPYRFPFGFRHIQ